jgi:hypothetical protein
VHLKSALRLCLSPQPRFYTSDEADEVFSKALAVFQPGRLRTASADSVCVPVTVVVMSINEGKLVVRLVCSDYCIYLFYLEILSFWRKSNSTALPMNIFTSWKQRRAGKRAKRRAKAQSDEIDHQLEEESKHRKQEHDILLISPCFFVAVSDVVRAG